MIVTDTLTRKIPEMRYLNADNADRYRCIMRAFYEQYGKLRYWLYEEEVFALLTADPYFAGYQEDQCRQDLNALVEWKNLVVVQDTKNARTLEEFKTRKYRYMMSDYSVEIERFVEHLENLHIEGASLEPSLLERIRMGVEKFPAMAGENPETVYTWWQDLNQDFIRLNQNYQDYIRDLNSVKAEEMMKTQAFLVFKDRLIEYLRNFVRSLQLNAGTIEEILEGLARDQVETVLEKAVEYDLSIPRMDTEVTREQLLDRAQGRFASIRDWFVGKGGGDNEAGKLFDATNDIIRRITRYAARISEQNTMGINRREEYRKLAETFLQCRDLEEAHCLGASVFGLEQTRHLRGEESRKTDSMNSSVYEEPALEVVLRSRSRTGREKERRSPVRDTSVERARVLREAREKQEQEQKKLAALEQDGRIDFAHLPVVEPQVREILLQWISRALENSEGLGRTESGRNYRLERRLDQPPCVLRCKDGNLTMPAMTLVFEK
ncbi:TIGR02677 family protein [uncultured Acidaminococcus sp.]|jgi:uncharacterized protein (TIGR02677 family)|uniref:TIGR02677 family protein n=1 Tax=uncultured Acidaminococcus sp. TaxID=352152 RepID=UPI00265FA273|nr:TIGR02677 family protein [uncultured Acidaminococcus sp.]